MVAIRISFYGLTLLLSLVLPGRGTAQPAVVPLLDGFWKGPLKMPGGQLEVIFRLVRLTSGEYYATLDVPLQKVSHLAVTVTVRGDTLLLASPQTGSRYAGQLMADGKQLQV